MLSIRIPIPPQTTKPKIMPVFMFAVAAPRIKPVIIPKTRYRMVFNVLGIFIEAFEYKNFVSTANKTLMSKSSGRDYITNHGHKCGNSTELSTQEIHERVERIVKSKVNS